MRTSGVSSALATWGTVESTIRRTRKAAGRRGFTFVHPQTPQEGISQDVESHEHVRQQVKEPPP